MDLDQIKQLIDLLLESEITEIEVEEEGTRIKVRKDSVAQQLVQLPASMSAASTAAARDLAGAPVEPENKYVVIKAPMVGTFYLAAAPDAPPFVKVGDCVDPEMVVCILEAMKIMNELKAGVSGVVRNILVDNGESVEYGQPLFEVEPA